LKGHVNGALNNGAMPDEIVEVFVRVPLTWGFLHRTRASRLAVEMFRERGLV
jgi:alkylhydroperoxidase/carboxymuconolactone decarboxylase family protein YurZ